MVEEYYAKINEKYLSFSDINAIFSAMYTPHTPADTAQKEVRHYQRLDDDFSVFNNPDKCILKGKITPTLINRLKGYGVSLIPTA